MKIKAILFDVNGTLIDIETDEGRERIYRTISKFLDYQGAPITPDRLRERYFALMNEQFKASREEFPEFDAVAIWQSLLQEEAGAGRSLPPDRIRQLPLFLAHLYRAISRKRLELYPDVSRVLEEFRPRYALGVVTDAQSAYAGPEMRALGLGDLFSPVVVSGDYGYRKPDRRLFQRALEALQLHAEQVVYVGNDMYRDVFGAQQAGMRTVFFSTQHGNKQHENVEADYVIHNFSRLPDAIEHLSRR
jgi:putative hydrolase of the HAD superfamily